MSNAPHTDPPTGTVTFLLTDIQNSTRLWEKDPASMRQALQRHDEIIETQAEKHHGCVVRPRGEGDSRFVDRNSRGNQQGILTSSTGLSRR